MKIDSCPAAPIIRVTSLGMDITIRLDTDDDKEIARLAIEVAGRHSRPTVVESKPMSQEGEG